MSGNKKLDKKQQNSIPVKIIDALSNLEPDYFIRSESYPFYPSDNFNLSEIIEESKRKEQKEDEQEYKIGNYLIKKTLGKGTFGKVKLGIYIPTQEKVAIKILEKSRIIEKDDEIRVKREFEMLTLFSHPNVILVAEIFESVGSFYSVMEYCEGGELFNYIVRNRRLSQNEAAFFYYQLINGLEYIHSLGIVHRDLKPENLLLTKDHILKIIDFGLSNYFTNIQQKLLITPCGSPCYASPEMVAGKKYNGFKIDIWSTGIILYAMLCGYLPFEDKDNDILFEKILECKLVFPKYISKMGKDLIEKILVTNPNKRISIEEIKKHPFYLKGKKIFDSEFSIYQIEKEMKEVNTDNDINKINDIHIIHNTNYCKENCINIRKRNKTLNNNERINKNEKTRKIKKENHILKDKEKENLIMRILTEGNEEKPILTLKNENLQELEKDVNNVLRTRENISSKKERNEMKKNKIKKKNINKQNSPFRNMDIIYNKNNNKNKTLLIEERTSKKEINDRKLIITNKYNNNIKNQLPKKHMIGKSVIIRKINYKSKENNYLNQYNNKFTNVIKSKFNSKDKVNKNNKRENIYVNNINNVIYNKYFNKKMKFNLNFGLNNTAEQTHKTNNSKTKKNMILTTFQTIDSQRKDKNYLDNLFHLNSNIKKYKQQLKDIKLNNIKYNDDIKIRLRNTLDNDNIEEKKKHNKLNTEILSGEKYKKLRINKDKLYLTKIYNNTNRNKNELINIIDNTKKELNNNTIQKFNVTLDTERQCTNENQTIQNPKTIEEIKIKRKIMNLKYYMNEIEKNNTYRKNREKIEIHKKNLNTDIINTFETKNNNTFNLKSIQINDYKKRTKKNGKEKILILENLPSDNIHLNSIDIINRTEPNQIIETIKTNRINYKKINNNFISGQNQMKKKITKKVSNNIKDIYLNSNNFEQKHKINFKKNKIIGQLNYEKNLNQTSKDFNIFHYSIANNINSSCKNTFDTIKIENSERKKNNAMKNFINTLNKNKGKKQNIMSLDKKPCVTIKNTVINLNIDTGIIIHPFDKKEKTKKIKNFLHHNTNDNQIQTIDIDNNRNLLTLNRHYYVANKNIINKMEVNNNAEDIIMNDIKMDENKILNKTMNNNIKRHIKFRSMKLDEISGNKFEKKDKNKLYLKTNQNFFKY